SPLATMQSLLGGLGVMVVGNLRRCCGGKNSIRWGNAQLDILNMVTRTLIAKIARIIWFIRRIVVALICGSKYCRSDKISSMGWRVGVELSL
ncbi:hypothetical protein VF13_36410, partial [Nostoc linckia z16]